MTVAPPVESVGETLLHTEIAESARRSFLICCPLFTLIVVAWSALDALMAPEWWWVFLGYRLAIALVSSVLFCSSLWRWVEQHDRLMLIWVLSIATGIAGMLPVLPTDALPFYVMGSSLCIVGLTTMTVIRPRDATVALTLYALLFVPTVVVRGLTDFAVVGSLFYLATLCAASMVQALHHYRMAEEGFHGRIALAQARDQALAGDQAKSAFLARMSHELRTPLNAIIGYAELIAEDAESSETLEDLSRIEGAGRHLLDVINDILDLSKIAAGELEVRLEPTDIGACVNALRPIAERLVAQNTNVLEWEVEAGQTADADPLRLRQVFLNLVSNAAKFTKNGTVAVFVKCTPDTIHIGVDDTGIGMDADALESAFLPFVQVHADPAAFGGTGLGLSLSQQLTARMGGTLTASSQLGHGSRFTLVLRRSAPESALDTQTEPT